MEKDWVLRELADLVPTYVDDDEPGQPPDVLTPRQSAMIDAYLEILDEFGQYSQTDAADGVDYDPGTENDDWGEGICCENCVFFNEGPEPPEPDDPNDLDPNGPDDTSPGTCMLVSGPIDPRGVCKLWVIPADDLNVQAAQLAARKKPRKKKIVVNTYQMG